MNYNGTKMLKICIKMKCNHIGCNNRVFLGNDFCIKHQKSNVHTVGDLYVDKIELLKIVNFDRMQRLFNTIVMDKKYEKNIEHQLKLFSKYKGQLKKDKYIDCLIGLLYLGGEIDLDYDTIIQKIKSRLK